MAGQRGILSVSTGAIELKVFSEHYKVELDVVDIKTQRIDRFGTFSGSVRFVGLMTHYKI